MHKHKGIVALDNEGFLVNTSWITTLQSKESIFIVRFLKGPCNVYNFNFIDFIINFPL